MSFARRLFEGPAVGRHARQFSGDVSLVTEALYLIMEAREGVQVPVDQLPITQGIATMLADCIAEMPILAVDDRNRPAGTIDVWTEPRDPDDEPRLLGRTFPVLAKPNPEEERGETTAKIVQSLFWTGNAYALNGPADAGDLVDSITVVDPNTVAPRIDPEDRLRVARWIVEGADTDRARLTHWKFNDDPRRGPLGETPLRRCGAALDMYGWCYRFVSDYFGQGGNPSSYLKRQSGMSNTKAVELAQEWIEARRRRRPAVLPHDVTFEVPSSNSEQQIAIEVLDFAGAEIARMFNVPPSIANAMTRGYSLTYANMSDEFRRWLAISLRPTWIRRIERGYTKLLPDGLRARLDPGDLFDAPTAGTVAEPVEAPAPGLEVPA